MTNRFAAMLAFILLYPGSSLLPARAADPAGARTEAYKKAAGPCVVETATYDWLDARRNREAPVKIYYPKTGESLSPIIIFSHGLGGTREGYEYLGRYWASHGYVSVHLQHKGSDDAVWKGAAQPMESMRKAAMDLQNAINRPLDVRFAIDQMADMNRKETPLKGRLDLDRIGMAGHSFGAYTTLAVAGEVFVGPRGNEFTLSDPRVKAAIAMSSPAPRQKDHLDRAFGQIKIPCLHMTGTLDYSLIADNKPEERRIPFDHMNGADQYLVTFKDGDHMIFSGSRGRMRNGAKDPLYHDLIRMSTAAFWDAYLKGDTAAKTWLSSDGFEAALGEDGTFEKKLLPLKSSPDRP